MNINFGELVVWVRVSAYLWMAFSLAMAGVLMDKARYAMWATACAMAIQMAGALAIVLGRPDIRDQLLMLLAPVLALASLMWARVVWRIGRLK